MTRSKNKRRSTATPGRGTGRLLGAGALVVLALGVALWVLLDDTSGANPDEPAGAVVAGGDAPTDEAPMIVPTGVERDVSRLEVPDAPTAARADASHVAQSVATRSVTGRILRLADRSPVTDAVLSASEFEQTRTDIQDGSFALRVAEGDRTLQLFLGNRRLIVKLPSVSGDLEGIELVVDTGWIIPGVVRSVSGEPIPNAFVSCEGMTVPSDAAGRFRLLDIRPTTRSPTRAVRAVALMHESGQVGVLLPAGQRVTPGVEIVLRGAGALEGWVHPPAGSQLQEGTPVRILLSLIGGYARMASKLLRTTVEEDGHYRIDGIPAGRFFAMAGRTNKDRADGRTLRALGYLDASADEVAVPSVDDDFGTPELWLPDIVITEGEVTRLDVHLPAGGVVTGRVTDAAGNPLVRAVVEAVRRQVWVGARGKGSTTSTSGGLLLTVGEVNEGEVALSATMGSTTTDERGVFELKRLPPGEVALRAEHKEHPGWRISERVVTVVSGVRSTGVDLHLGEGRAVRGRVFDALGQPAGQAVVAILRKDDPVTAHAAQFGAQVAMQKDGIHVGPDGRFDLAGLPDGPLTLLVTLVEHQTQMLDVEPSARELRIDLMTAVVLRGRVTDARTNEPVHAFQVRVRGNGLTMTRPFNTVDGRFSVDGLEQKPYRIEITAHGYQQAVIEDVRPSFDGVEREVLLVPTG